MPNRDRSNRDAPAAIISMAQHARPNVTGHSEALRRYPARSSIVVSRNPDGASSTPMSPPSCRAPPGVAARRRGAPCVKSSSRPSDPVEAAAPPLVHERHGDESKERQHRHQAERRERREVDGPRVEEDDLDVEDD